MVLLDRVAQAIQQELGQSVVVWRTVKFNAPVVPPQTCVLEVAETRRGWSITVSTESGLVMQAMVKLADG